MQFKHLSMLALASGAMAAAVPRQVDPALQQLNYTILVLRSASPVHFTTVTAVNGSFYMGNVNTTSFCPDDVKVKGGCPPGNQTVFKDSCSLSSENPNIYGWPEQTIYNTDDGKIGYDAQEDRPVNAYNCPWYVGTADNDAFAGTLVSTYGGDGFLACPTQKEDVYELVRDVQGGQTYSPLGDINDCLGITLEAVKYNATEYGAYVYS